VHFRATVEECRENCSDGILFESVNVESRGSAVAKTNLVSLFKVEDVSRFEIEVAHAALVEVVHRGDDLRGNVVQNLIAVA
jgi:hypothetical protein